MSPPPMNGGIPFQPPFLAVQTPIPVGSVELVTGKG